ncbi:MAG: LD-carboxypeptidase [Clostridia bacterium]|nr:LD-carboxypeptidase [Clostridia bacterium]
MKPKRLLPGDTIATISPSWGCAGASDVRWRYDLGVHRLEALGLHVVSAPNALRGEEYLDKNPQARADDLMWAFENKDVQAIIANIGGNDSHHILPYLSAQSIQQNPKVLCGYSDVTTLHLYCHRLGLSTFYGSNLLTTIAENDNWHPYSKYWFEKTLFDTAPLGVIPSSFDCSLDPNQVFDQEHTKQYEPNPGYQRIQGSGIARGKLWGGNGETLLMCAALDAPLINTQDFKNTILFIEDLPQSWNQAYIERLFRWLGNAGHLQTLSGIIIGRFHTGQPSFPYRDIIKSIITNEYALPDLSVLYGLNFGHMSPICMLPYDAEAEINVDNLSFRILEHAVL